MTELIPHHDGCMEEVRTKTQLVFSWTMRAFVKPSFYNILKPIPGSPFARSLERSRYHMRADVSGLHRAHGASGPGLWAVLAEGPRGDDWESSAACGILQE